MSHSNMEHATTLFREAGDLRDAAAGRRPLPQLPPPPISFTRRQPSAAVVCKPAVTPRQARQIRQFIQSARRNLFEEILESDIFPVESVDGQPGLWAAVENIFLQ